MCGAMLGQCIEALKAAGRIGRAIRITQCYRGLNSRERKLKGRSETAYQVVRRIGC